MALNNVSLMGRLVADPELRTVGEDIQVVSFRIAVDRDRKNKDGEREADFFNVTAWRGAADFVSSYFMKGDMIVVCGRLQSRTYTDKDGNNRSVVEVLAENVYFGSAKKEGGNTNAAPAAQGAYATPDSDLPF